MTNGIPICHFCHFHNVAVRSKGAEQNTSADPDVQGQMRHSRIATTMDIYAQFVPESQQRAIAKMTTMVQQRLAAKPAAEAQASQVTYGSQLGQ